MLQALDHDQRKAHDSCTSEWLLYCIYLLYCILLLHCILLLYSVAVPHNCCTVRLLLEMR